MQTGRGRSPIAAPPSEGTQVRPVDDEPTQAHRRAHPHKAISKLDRVSPRQDQNGLAHPHHAGPVNEARLVVRRRSPLAAPRVLPSEDQGGHSDGTRTLRSAHIIGHDPQVDVGHTDGYIQLYNSFHWGRWPKV